MHFENSADYFGGSAVRRPVGYDSVVAMSKLVALLPNYMQIVQNWSGKGVYIRNINTRAAGFRTSHRATIENIDGPYIDRLLPRGTHLTIGCPRIIRTCIFPQLSLLR